MTADIFDAVLLNNEIILAEACRSRQDLTGAINHINTAIRMPAKRCVRDWLHLAKDAIRRESGQDVIAPASFSLCVNSLRNVLY